MPLIYPAEAWRRFGPPPIWVYDARGRLLQSVMACDPETGEVIAYLPVSSWWIILLAHLGLAGACRCPRALWRFLRSLGIQAPPGEIVKRHWFAPAPLTITREKRQ